MRPSKRLERIPPYLFAQLERKIAEKKAQGIDVISLGIGDPDTPTPALVVDALRDAATDPGTHQYPSNRGREEFRRAVASFYERRFGVEIDAATEVVPALGAKECSFNLTWPSSIPATPRWPPTRAIRCTPAVPSWRAGGPGGSRSSPGAGSGRD